MMKPKKVQQRWTARQRSSVERVRTQLVYYRNKLRAQDIELGWSFTQLRPRSRMRSGYITRLYSGRRPRRNK